MWKVAVLILKARWHKKGNKIFLYNKLALKKRVYEASDWDNYRDAVNAHKTYGDYLVIKK